MNRNHGDLAEFCRGLSLLLHGGISLSDGVFLLAEEAAGETKHLYESLGASLDRGLTLSQAMAESGSFPDHVLGMTAVGEAAGRLEEALGSLADFYEERRRTSRQIRAALSYPCVLVVLMLGVIGILLTQVLPVFDRVYASLGSPLTGIPAGLLRLGQGLETAMPLLLVFLGLLAVLALFFARNAGFRNRVSKWFLVRFGDRGIFRKFNNARFAGALAMGLGSGMALEEALTLSCQLLADAPTAARRCEGCLTKLEQGEPLADAMTAAQLLTPAQSRMLGVGLRSGSGDQVMVHIAQTLAEEAQEALTHQVSKIEPALVLLCSILVGAILLTVMLPLMNILSALG